METCDVLIVGGGPAGSTCAWQLAQLGFDVVVIDKSRFPRDKTCAGWLVPQIVESLQLDQSAYALGRVWQPITGFQIGLFDGPGETIRFDHPVSFGIRRCEFDEFLLRRSGARLRLGESVRSIERVGAEWIINGTIRAPLLIGAGGNFCPVARLVRAERGHTAPLVTAMEIEIPIADQSVDGTLDGTMPRLYFCDDLAGYGWCIRKQGVLNLGIGRVDARDVPAHWARLLRRFEREQIVRGPLSHAPHGHAYHVYDATSVPLSGDGILLIGDSAGLADPRSGEGIRPAVESGLLAASTIRAAQGDYGFARLRAYDQHIRRRFGDHTMQPGSSHKAPGRWRRWLLTALLKNAWFDRHLILNRWFLHRQLPALLPDQITP